MPVISKVLELGPDQTTRLKPHNNEDDSGPYEITAVMTEVDVGVRFEGSNGCRTPKTLMNEEEVNTRLFIDSNTCVVIDSDRNARTTVFLSIKTP